MYCPICGTALPDGARFCSKCGKPIVIAQPGFQGPGSVGGDRPRPDLPTQETNGGGAFYTPPEPPPQGAGYYTHDGVFPSYGEYPGTYPPPPDGQGGVNPAFAVGYNTTQNIGSLGLVSKLRSLDKKTLYIIIGASAFLLIALILICSFSCGSCFRTGDDIVSQNVSGVKNGAQFTTEYTVVDYHDGCFIVTTSSGRTYGALDIHGEEILPLEYDYLEFVGKRSKFNKYIYAKLNEKEGVFSLKGKVIIPLEYDHVEYFKFECKATYARNAGSYAYDVYSSDGALLTTINDYKPYVLSFLGDKYIMLSSVNALGMSDGAWYKIVDYNGKLIDEFDCGSEYTVDDPHPIVLDGSVQYLLFQKSDESVFMYKIIDDKLNTCTITLTGEDIDNKQDFSPVAISSEYYSGYFAAATTALRYENDIPIHGYSLFSPQNGLISKLDGIVRIDGGYGDVGLLFGQNEEGDISYLDASENLVSTGINVYGERWDTLKEALVYSSGDVWKLADKNGRTIGDKQYSDFDTIESRGRESFNVFSNTDGEYCIYSPDGRLVVPYGVYTRNGDASFLNGSYIQNTVASYDAICFITSDENGKNVVNWYGKTEH